MSRVFLYNETIYIPALKTQEAKKVLSSVCFVFRALPYNLKHPKNLLISRRKGASIYTALLVEVYMLPPVRINTC